jgi:hypothetical protein
MQGRLIVLRVAFVLPLGLIQLLVGTQAKAQFIWGNALPQNQVTQQQQDITDPMRTGTEHVQGQPVASPDSAGVNTHQDYSAYVIPPGDALEGTNSPTYKLSNGSIITVSGGFRPDIQPPPPSTSGKGAKQ